MASYQEHIPAFPLAFGDDKGEFFLHYDRIQDGLDEEMIKRLNQTLDGQLVFAGLLAGINSAFLALTLDLMSPNPIEDSPLLQGLMEGLNSPANLPPTSFTPPLRAVFTNVLFALSLCSALSTTFFAIFGKQWLAFYRSLNRGGVDQQRWERLRRSLGAERWGLVPLLEFGLPGLIQSSLLFFSVGLVLFLQTMSQSLALLVLTHLLGAGFLFILTVGFSLWDVSCPYKTPLSEGVLRAPLILSAAIRLFRRLRDSDRVTSGSYNPNDEETGAPHPGVINWSAQASPPLQTINRPHLGKGRWRWLVDMVMWRGQQARMNLKPRLSEFFQGIDFGRKTEDEGFLQVESIKRVIDISEDPIALYHAALNLRPITDSNLLKLVCDNESTTRGLRRCYLEALEELEEKGFPDAKLLRQTLAFGTAFFHVLLSAASFDDFITILGMKGVTLPRGSLEMSPREAQMTGDNCRRAQWFVRKFINLQMRGLGPQPTALTSTTLAANALWFAINGIPHSQDVVYGDQFRQALAFSEVSWTGLGLLAFVSHLTCPFYDAGQQKPYGITELSWCRSAFLRVKNAYSLSKPNQELAEAVRASLSTRKNLESNAILFKFAWRLFSWDDEEDTLIKLGEHALSAGYHLICAIEDAIRFSRGGKKYEIWREMCFKSMIECMGPRDGEIKSLRRTAWRRSLVLKTATAYMNYIMGLDGPFDNDDNAFAKKVMEQIRQAQIQSLAVAIALGIEHAHAKREFEGVFFKLWPLQSHGVSTEINIGHMGEPTTRPSPTQFLNKMLAGPGSRRIDNLRT